MKFVLILLISLFCFESFAKKRYRKSRSYSIKKKSYSSRSYKKPKKYKRKVIKKTVYVNNGPSLLGIAAAAVVYDAMSDRRRARAYSRPGLHCPIGYAKVFIDELNEVDCKIIVE